MSIHYIRQGAGKPTFVFIHGFLCNHTHWAKQVDFFSNEGTVLAVDLPGHGASVGQSGRMNVSDVAREVVDVIKSNALENIFLVGHSMGCRIATEVAYQLGPDAHGLVLVDGSKQGKHSK